MNNDLPKVHKKTSFYVCLVLGAFMVLSAISDWLYGSIDMHDNAIIPFFWGMVLLVVAYFLKRRNDQERTAYNQAVEARKAELQRLENELETQKAEVQEIKEKYRAEQNAAKARQIEWERTHGRIITKVAGVTYDNEDGSSRQRILKAAMAEETSGSITLELYDYRGTDAIAVLYDGEEIGNIPKNRVAEVKAVMDRITGAHLDVDRFRPEDEDDDEPRGLDSYIYRADLTLVYAKEPDVAS